MLTIRELEAADAAALQALRLDGLERNPEAFLESAEEWRARPLSDVADMLRRDFEQPDKCILGAFEGAELLGMLGLARNPRAKARNKAVVWGVYVLPEHRRKGVGAALFDELLRRARHMEGLCQLQLGVWTENTAALALYRKYGFAEFGIERQAMRFGGRDYDEMLMACFL